MIAVTASLPTIATAAAAEPLAWSPCATTAKGWDPTDTLTECALLTVPMDYADPNGRKIKAAVSRRKATDPAKRRGALVISPGGPGLSNITAPSDYATGGNSPFITQLADQYDFIGLDPRGTGYSDKVDCADDAPTQPVPPTAPYRDKAKAGFDREAAFNKRCAAADPGFVHQLTTTNIARDVDSLRAALGESKISFYGVSYGTAVGVNYRSLFDSHVDRMWIDSDLPPVMDLGAMDATEDAFSQQQFDRFVPWLAQHDAEYHFGGDAAGVRSALFALRDQLDKSPRPVDDTTAIDGQWIRGMFGISSSGWVGEARDLAIVRDGGIPQSVRPPQPAARKAFGFQDPPYFNGLEYNAIFCNEGTGGRDFDQVWATAQANAAKYPATGGRIDFQQWCGDWPWPAQPWHPVKGSSAFEVSGHIDEGTTPYAWAVATHQAAGGAFLSIQDFSHGSISRIPCGSKLADFFRTGRTVNGTCLGME